MMTKTTCTEQKLIFTTLDQLVPKKHFLRDLDRLVNFDFIYDLVAPLYSNTGRASIDLVIIIKMLLIAYLYGINSERKLEEEVQVNLAYRWFLGIELDEKTPDHSTLSQLRRRKFKGTRIFEEIFTKIVFQCIEMNLIDGKLLLSDSTHIRANTSNEKRETITVEVEPSEFLKRLNEQAKKDGLHVGTVKKKEKSILKSTTDPDSGFMKRKGKPLDFHYLSHQTCDGKFGLVTSVCVTPGNVSDSTVHSREICSQIDKFNFKTEGVCADSGHDSSEIHKDMLDRGIKTHIVKRNRVKERSEKFTSLDFDYQEETDRFICPNGETLIFNDYRANLGAKRYKSTKKQCDNCALSQKCLSNSGNHKEVERAYYKPTWEKQHESDFSDEYKHAMKRRKILAEGNFAHQKRNHNLRRMTKIGLDNAREHCLLSATAFNLKRMVRLKNQG